MFGCCYGVKVCYFFTLKVFCDYQIKRQRECNKNTRATVTCLKPSAFIYWGWCWSKHTSIWQTLISLYVKANFLFKKKTKRQRTGKKLTDVEYFDRKVPTMTSAARVYDPTSSIHLPQQCQLCSALPYPLAFRWRFKSLFLINSNTLNALWTLMKCTDREWLKQRLRNI